jgi:hypothetical protein
MKNYIKIIIALVLILGTGTAYALKWSDTKNIKDGDFQEIRRNDINNANIRIYKFNDDGNTCYLSYSNYQQIVGSMSLQCKIN